MKHDLLPGDLFLKPRSPEDIVSDAMAYDPDAIFCGFSGGDGSRVAAHWAMNNVPGCKILHINTGIGIEKSRQNVRETCAFYGWPLVEVRAKEDCGFDYEQIVLKHGFPGPGQHIKMYSQLKERAIRKVVREHKKSRNGKVMILTGINKEDSQRRMGYGAQNINFVGAQMWVNHLYWWPKSRFYEYLQEHQISRSPVSIELGMSGECLCGAFAHKGEKEMVRLIEPETAERIDRLEAKVREAGHAWGWEEAPPAPPKNNNNLDMFAPMCVGCGKDAVPSDKSQGGDV